MIINQINILDYNDRVLPAKNHKNIWYMWIYKYNEISITLLHVIISTNNCWPRNHIHSKCEIHRNYFMSTNLTKFHHSCHAYWNSSHVSFEKWRLTTVCCLYAIHSDYYLSANRKVCSKTSISHLLKCVHRKKSKCDQNHRQTWETRMQRKDLLSRKPFLLEEQQTNLHQSIKVEILIYSIKVHQGRAIPHLHLDQIQDIIHWAPRVVV